MAFRSTYRQDGIQLWSVAQLGAFYAEHRAEFLAHATRILRSKSRAEEVVQDSIIKVILAAPELSSKEHAISYMHRTIETVCIDIFRLEGRKPNLVVLDDVKAEIDLKWQSNLDHAEVIAAADDAVIVREALSLLSAAERAALVMWEIEGRSTEEIAKELGIKESAVRHTVSRARASLRRVLSNMIIDQDRGITALDALSSTYKKSIEVAKRSSKAVMSLILVFFAFIGFNSMPNHEKLKSLDFTPNNQLEKSSKQATINSINKNDFNLPRNTIQPKSSVQKSTIAAKPNPLSFLGLDKDGIPTGFTITDSTGSLGSLYISKSMPKATEDGIALSVISKTKFGSANIFLSQDLTVDGNGTSYKTGISVGMNGNWVPLNLSQTNVDIERLSSGNYLVTATMVVESVVETPITVPSSANGTDLASAPKSVITRLLLSASKTQVLAQAVLVNESGKAGKA